MGYDLSKAYQHILHIPSEMCHWCWHEMLKFSSDFNKQSSKSIHIWTMATLESWCTHHDSSPDPRYLSLDWARGEANLGQY